MENQNPVTPPQGATPGNVAQNGNQLPVTPPTPPGSGENQEGKVTITTKEYRDLQRAKARTLSFDKRTSLRNRTEYQPANPDGSNDPAIVEQLNQAQIGRQEAERRALQAEVRGKVRDLLEKEEFKALPKSTKDLILKNPAMLTEADNLEEALLDIEDFVREKVLEIDVPANNNQPGQPAQQPKGHEAPPVINSGSPAPADAAGLEDVSKLSGPARSQAAIRNAIKKAKGVRQI